MLLTSLSEANKLLMKLRLLRIEGVGGDQAFESEQVLFCKMLARFKSKKEIVLTSPQVQLKPKILMLNNLRSKL